MDTKILRQKILDLAIRGKLVPQDPNDEPASILLERIKAEKERLIKEGKIKRSKKSVPFEIPDNWVWTTIEEICSKIGSGSTPRGSNYSVKGIPFFRSQNVYNDRLVYDDIKYISEEVHQKMKGTEVLANDLLLNITGGSLGRCAVVPADFNCGNVSQHVCIMRSVLVEPEYSHALVLSSYFTKSMKITGSGREGLPKYNLEQMYFPLPPLTEQQRIVTEIEHWFALLDQIEKEKLDLQTIIKQTKSKVLDIAIHGKLVSQDPNEEPAIKLLKRINPDFTPCDNGHYTNLPIGWVVAPMQMLCSLTDGEKLDGKEMPNLDVKYLRGERDFKTLTNGRYVVANSLLILVDGENSGEVFRTQIEGYQGSTFKQLHINKNMFAEYILHVINLHRKALRENKVGSAIPHLDKKLFKAIEVPVPPYKEQVRIVAAINSMYSRLDTIMEIL